jgi:hypothetical protein
MFWMQSASAAGGIDGTDLELTFCKVFYGGWATLPLYPNERISFYGCQTLRFLKGPGLDAASSLKFCENHCFSSGGVYRLSRFRAIGFGTFLSAEARAAMQISLKVLAV